MPRHVVIARDPLIAGDTVKKLIPADVPCERHFTADLSIESIFGMLGTDDLFATKRAYHYVDFLALKPGKKESERLAGILARLPAEIILVCSQVLSYATRGEENRALKGKAYQLWADGAKVKDLRKLSEGRNAVDWLRERAQAKYKLSLTPSQAELLLSASDQSPALAESELAKLWMLLPDEKHSVSDKTINAVLNISPGKRFYDLADAIMAGASDWHKRLVDWYLLEPKPERLIGELKRRLLGLLALSRGQQVQPPFFARQLHSLERRWPAVRVRAAIRQLAELEHGIKSGLATGESSAEGKLSALELYIAGLRTRR